MKPVALVTGAGRGLGAALAARLAARGYALALHAFKSQAGAQALRDQLRRAGAEAECFAGDLAREAEAQVLVREVTERFGRIDVLINNAGVYHEKKLQELSEGEWFEGLNSTASAVFFTTRAALPELRKSGRGRVINIGDSSCERPGARDLAVSYHIGKTGVYMLSRSFAQEEAGHGVTVNLVSPGYLEGSVGLPEAAKVPAGRWGTYEDVWNAVEFLLKPESGYLTGSNLVLSGGWNLR